MRVLIACEFSGTVRDAFRALGHDAWSCDIANSDSLPERHIKADVLDILGAGWDLMIAHPPCTYLSRAGARWWKEPGRDQLADAAADFVFKLWVAPIEKIAIENPIGQLNKRWRYADQEIQPHWFGDPYSKTTCLWLKNLPPLKPTKMCPVITHFLPSNTGGKKKGQQFSFGVAKNARDASRTFPGIAKAMAEQWGGAVSTR